MTFPKAHQKMYRNSTRRGPVIEIRSSSVFPVLENPSPLSETLISLSVRNYLIRQNSSRKTIQIKTPHQLAPLFYFILPFCNFFFSLLAPLTSNRHVKCLRGALVRKGGKGSFVFNDIINSFFLPPPPFSYQCSPTLLQSVLF